MTPHSYCLRWLPTVVAPPPKCVLSFGPRSIWIWTWVHLILDPGPFDFGPGSIWFCTRVHSILDLGPFEFGPVFICYSTGASGNANWTQFQLSGPESKLFRTGSRALSGSTIWNQVHLDPVLNLTRFQLSGLDPGISWLSFKLSEPGSSGYS